MLEIDKIPTCVLDYAYGKGVDVENIFLSLRCDMNSEHTYCDTYLMATSDTLYIIWGSEGLVSRQNPVKGGLDVIWNEGGYSEYKLSSLKDFKVEELLSGARLTAREENGEYVFLTAMTNFCKSSTLLFIKYLNKIKKGEIKDKSFTVEPEDDPKSQHCPKCGMRYPNKHRKICPKCMEKGKLFARFGVFLAKYKLYIFIMLASLILLSATSILAPYFSSGFFYDQVLDEDGGFYGELLLVIAIVVGTKILSQIANIINGYITSKISARVVYDLKMTIFGAIERLSLGFFNGRQTGGLMTQVNNDANTIYGFFCDGIPYFLINIVQVIALCIILFIMNPVLAALSLLTIPVFFIVLRKFYRTSMKYHARNYSSQRSMNGLLSDVLSGMRVVKAFSKEEEEITRFDKSSTRVAKSNKKLAVFNNYSYPLSGIILYLGNIIALGVGGWMVIKGYGDFTYGQLLTFTAYINMIYSPMYFFSQMVDWSASSSNALQRLFEILDTKPDITEKEDAVELSQMEGSVEFKDVDFSYAKNRKIIDRVSFKVDSGSILGIVGHTGAGKSTIANLIIRLYDCDDGEVLIDGFNVKDLSFASLYNNIAIVSQETYLFIGTILENIKYAKPDASYEEVIHASKCAGAHDFIMKLPDGYDTKIGFGFKGLSGGERQRVSIARAILRDPKILILDEATAAMDTETEKLIQNALGELTRGKTTIMIAHRLSTLRDADKLIVIERGKVAEEGTHRELLDKEEGVYKKLYTLQAEALKNAGITE
ncbi:MAG: ATP-binding cassette domain-containing protein [Clostridia bacterium]|nr:ATP-binding cassette domain-containing protein [Clostridia bacterium]